MGNADGVDGRAISAKVAALEPVGLVSPLTLVSSWDIGKSFVGYRKEFVKILKEMQVVASPIT